jgi:hypothetical protein
MARLDSLPRLRVVSGLFFLLALPHASDASDIHASPIINTPPATSALHIPRVDHPPALEDFLEMQPSPAWQGKLAMVTNFIQRLPDNGQPATQSTDAYLGYDSHALYVIFVAHDTEPAKIRARLDRRETISPDEDQVGIYLDTFHDRRRAYQFECNALGVQDDSIYTEDTETWDEGFDTVWTSRGQLTAGGYVLFMSIPFKSLRFSHETAQTWNVGIWRWLGRRSEGSWWPRVNSEVRGILSQAAPVSGLENISPGRNFQFIPYASWRAFHAVDARDPGNPVYQNRAAEMLGGADAKAILKDSLVLDLTAKPDFSQVESDTPLITTNQRYELFYPEKRPFFTENSSYFSVPMIVPSQSMLFTRRIADPDFGARLTGKLGHTSLGMLFADDRSPGEVVAPTDPLAGQKAYFGVFRITRDLPARSNVGFFYGDREFAGSYSRAATLDTTLNLGPTWKSTIMGGYNWSRGTDGSLFSGSDVDATLTRVARGFNYIGYFVNRAPGFQPEMAFLSHSDWRELGQTFAYQFWPKNSWITRIWTEVYGARNWHYNGALTWEGIKPMVKVEIKHNTTLTGYIWEWHDIFGPQDFTVLQHPTNFPLRPAYGLGIASTQSRFINLNLTGEWGTRSNVAPPSGLPPTEAKYQTAEADISFLTSRGLTVTNTYLFDRNASLSGAPMYNAHIFRSKWNLQVNRELSFRFIGQYNATLANPGLTSTPTARNFNADFLITYLVHPGTALYVGYNSNLSNPSQIAGPCPNCFVNDGRQLFVKVSYLFRF